MFEFSFHYFSKSRNICRHNSSTIRNKKIDKSYPNNKTLNIKFSRIFYLEYREVGKFHPLEESLSEYITFKTTSPLSCLIEAKSSSIYATILEKMFAAVYLPHFVYVYSSTFISVIINRARSSDHTIMFKQPVPDFLQSSFSCSLLYIRFIKLHVAIFRCNLIA